MKRPPGLWLLLSAGVLWLSMQDVYGIRATALIFGRGSTTSTTTEEPASEESLVTNNKTGTNADNSTSTNTTSPANATRVLTGIPQIDYIYDPNLPRELNGYNLSDYPFYHRVPEETEIEFKCDGLHDGFYASVPHKCQVYHHCLFGTRYDFLCANYTAFDQKTFICHFVSEVDCNNSHKFWHRNDALYQAASTTTVAPSTTTTTTTTASPPPSDSGRPGNGNGGRRRKPLRRPRPQYDYYDDEDYDSDYYEPPPPRQRGRRKRPRPRPRPIYDDEYDEEYEDDRYERRGSGRRGAGDRERRPYDNRQQYDDEKHNKKRLNDDRRHMDDKPSDEENRRPSKNEDRRPNKRRPSDERNYETPNRNDKHSRDDDYYEDESSNTRINTRPNKNKYANEESEDTEEKPIVKPVSGSSIYGQPRKAPRIRPPVPKNEQNKFNYKATSNSKTTTTAAPVKQIEETDYEYEEEELPPSRSKPRQKPVNTNNSPKRPTKSSSERSETKETTKATTYGSRPRGGYRKPVVDNYNDEEVEEEPPKPRRPYRYRPNGRNGGNRKRPPVDDDSVKEDEMETAKSQNKKSTVRTESKFSEEESEKKDQTTRTPHRSKENDQPSKPTEKIIEATTAKVDSAKGHHQSYVRVVKRPFLPSRGGNPYSPRGLKPVGAKSLEDKRTQENSPEVKIKDEKLSKQENINDEEEEEEIYEDTLTNNNQNEEIGKHQDVKSVSSNLQKQSKPEIPTKPHLNENTDDVSSIRHKVPLEAPEQINQKPLFKPSPQIIKIPLENKYIEEPYVEASQEEVVKPIRNHHETLVRPNFKAKFPEPLTTTNKPVYDEKSPLDIPDDEYDVTLNEAINPTLPNLPLRSYPTGFSNGQGFPYNNFQRPRTNQQFKPSYQIRPTNHGSIIVPHEDSSAYLSSESGYNPNLNEEPQIYRPQNFRSSPHVTQVRTQPFYY